MPEQITLLRVVVVSPSDVKAERDVLQEILEEVNRDSAHDRGFHLHLSRWETDALPGFHPKGVQGIIDPMLKIKDADIVVGIFWTRFGTPTASGLTGTEHELKTAYAAWQTNGRPHIMLYFNQAPYSPTTSEETEQWNRVLKFKEGCPREGLWWPYNGKDNFSETVRRHLRKFITMQVSLPSTTATRYLEGKKAFDHAIKAVSECQSEIVAIHNWGMRIQPTPDASKDDSLGDSIAAYYSSLVKKVEGSSDITYIRIFQIPDKGAGIIDPEVVTGHLKECIKLRGTSRTKLDKVRFFVCKVLYTTSFLLIDEKVVMIHVHKLDEATGFYYSIGNIVIEANTPKALTAFHEMSVILREHEHVRYPILNETDIDRLIADTQKQI